MLFSGENVPFSKVVGYQQISLPTGAGQVGAADGSTWYDSSQKCVFSQINGLTLAAQGFVNGNVTPVTATNPSAEAALMSFSFPAQSLNVVGKVIYIWAAGVYTTAAAQTPSIQFRVRIGGLAGVQLASWTSTVTTASASNMPWNLEMYATVQANGASGAFEAHGILDWTGGASPGAAISSFNDANSAVSAAVDLTVAQSLVVTAIMSTGAAGNSVVQRQMVIELSQ